MSVSETAANKPNPRDLKEEALLVRERLREARRQERAGGFSRGRRWLYGVCIFGVLGVAFLLLAWGEARSRAVMLVAGIFVDLEPAEDQVFQLPPPPPVATETKTGPAVRLQGSTVTFSDEGFEGVLYADMDPVRESDSADSGGEGGFVPPAKTTESEAAFALLQQKSPIVTELVAGGVESFEFKEWTPVKVDPPVYFIDLMATRTADGVETHLVWEVNVESEEIRPLSQAARDLAK